MAAAFELGLLPPELLDDLADRFLPSRLLSSSATGWLRLLRFSAICGAARAAAARAVGRRWPVLLAQGTPPPAQLLSAGRQLSLGQPCDPHWRALRAVEWSVSPQRHHPRPRARSGASLAVLGPTTLMAFGGRLSTSGDTLAETLVANVSQQLDSVRWDVIERSIAAPGPAARCYHTCCAVSPAAGPAAACAAGRQAAAVLFGGSGDGATLHGDAWFFTVGVDGCGGDGRWELIEAPGGPSPRSAHVAVCWAGCLYVHGGLDEDGVCGDLWRLDFASCSWGELTGQHGPQRIPRAHHAAAIFVDSDGLPFLDIVGGQDVSLLTCATVHRLELPAGQMPAHRRAAGGPLRASAPRRRWSSTLVVDETQESDAIARIDACVLPLPDNGGWVCCSFALSLSICSRAELTRH